MWVGWQQKLPICQLSSFSGSCDLEIFSWVDCWKSERSDQPPWLQKKFNVCKSNPVCQSKQLPNTVLPDCAFIEFDYLLSNKHTKVGYKSRFLCFSQHERHQHDSVFVVCKIFASYIQPRFPYLNAIRFPVNQHFIVVRSLDWKTKTRRILKAFWRQIFSCSTLFCLLDTKKPNCISSSPTYHFWQQGISKFKKKMHLFIYIFRSIPHEKK